MGTRAALLVTVHVVACFCFVGLSYLTFTFEASEGSEPGSVTALDLVLPLALLLLGLGVWVALAKGGHRRIAVLLVVAEAAVGIALWRAMGSSGLSDYWLYLAALILGGSGLGAAAAGRARRACV